MATAGGRTFAALVLPAELRRTVALGLDGLLAGREDGLRRSREDGLHVTLHFAGELAGDAVERWRASLERGLAGLAAPRLVVTAPGAFAGRRAVRVLWVGVEEEGDPGVLGRLREAVVAAADAAGLPAARDARKPFHPHVTVGRARRGTVRGLPAALWEVRFDLPWRPAAVTLLRSQLGPGGARYEELARFPLTSRAP